MTIMNVVRTSGKDMAIETMEAGKELGKHVAIASAVAAVYTSRNGADLAVKAANKLASGSERMARWILSQTNQ